ncbi:DUF4132 domain-containing protein [Streptomyces sp. A5-4]|uniref:DUF4132 domain-containing protein n=1 Tax=Streptomyces sp. A5-4 TaxID=3384771 RepID=UPI003DA7B8AA
MAWFPAGDDQVALDDGKVVCRNAAGRLLKSVPAKLSDDPAVVGLRQLTEWLDQHEQQCLADVERWMVRSLPAPVTVFAEVWPDPSWQSALRDLIVTDADGEVAGFLRDADSVRGLDVLGLDGNTVRIMPGLVRVPHSALLDDLEEIRRFAADQGIRQRIGQRAGQVLRRDDRTVVILRLEEDSTEKRWFALGHDPSGEFGAVAHFAARKERRHAADLPADRITALTAVVRAEGAAPWRPTAVGELATATRLGLGLPVETWKERLYPLSDHQPPVPITSVAELFARAWAHVRAGTPPRSKSSPPGPPPRGAKDGRRTRPDRQPVGRQRRRGRPGPAATSKRRRRTY